ncbi:class I SAM-dependent methyltransferase [Thermodesulfobacteriota bacterium]
MGHVFDFQDALAHQERINQPRNRDAANLENRLMLDMLKPQHGSAVLEIGCGAGLSLLPLVEAGLQASGLDPSPYMLDIASKNLGERVDLHRGFAEDLPFDDNSFHYALFMTTLEFVEDPQKAIAEACRVAKDRIFVGILNRSAIKGIQLRVKGLFTQTIYNHARLFTIWELKQVVRELLGDVPITWRTVSQMPIVSGRIAHKVEQFSLIQRWPFGAFAGMVVTLVPRYRTRPLPITYRVENTSG